MKILYVEDQLYRYVDTIKNMFASIFSAKVKRKFEDFSKKYSNSAFPCPNEEVQEIINSSSVVDVCFNFPDAIEKILYHYEDYDLFLIDRDLSDENYTFDELRKRGGDRWDDNWAQSIQTHKEAKREGDFLFSLLRDKIDYETSFYYLTANNESLMNTPGFDEPALSRFKYTNLIEKGNSEHSKRLLKRILDFKRGNFRIRMIDVFEVFDKRFLSCEIEKEFIETLRQMNNHNEITIKDNLARIRRIQEAIYIALNKYSEDIVPEKCLKNPKGDLAVRRVISSIENSQYHSALIKSSALNIYGISSDGGSHTPYEKPDYMPTQYTVQSLTYALCELLLWFKGIVDEK